MDHETLPLNGSFGILINGVTRQNLSDKTFQTEAYDIWLSYGGLVAVRGEELRDITNGLDTVDKINNVTWPTKPS